MSLSVRHILLSHLLWMWTLVQSMGVTKDSELCNVSWGKWMKSATQWAREAHLSAPSWFLWPSQIWNKDFWENVTFNTSVNYIIKHLYKGTKKFKRKMAKKKDKSTSKDFMTFWNSQVDLPEVWQVENTIQNQLCHYNVLPLLIKSWCWEYLLGKVVAINPELLIQKEPCFNHLT